MRTTTTSNDANEEEPFRHATTAPSEAARRFRESVKKHVIETITTINVDVDEKSKNDAKGGDTDILIWDPQAQREDTDTTGLRGRLKKLKIDKSDEHETPITCCDTLESAGFFVSGDQ